MAYAIRPFHVEDAGDLAQLTLAAIREIGSRHYSASQVAAWAGRHPEPTRFIERAEGGAVITVAADSTDTPVAYTLLEYVEGKGGHLDMLYCHPDNTRQGLAVQLLIAAEQHAVMSGQNRLYTEASELARAAFERAGYSVTHRRDFTIAHDGEEVSIHNYAMEKRL